jgi:hypothetical protein
MKISGNGFFETIVIKPRDLKLYAQGFARMRSFFSKEDQAHRNEKLPISKSALQGDESAPSLNPPNNKQNMLDDR